MSIFGNKTAERMRRFIKALNTSDLTLHFNTDRLKGTEKELAEDLNLALTGIRRNLSRQEAELGYYQAMLNNVDIAMIVADSVGNIAWMNEKAIKSLCGFKIPTLSSLKSLHPDLPIILDSAKPGEKRLVTLHINDHETQLKVGMTRYSQSGKSMRLFSIENVQVMLQQNEMEAQNKLISVLTHEIMNSLSPIISLSDTLCENGKEGCSLDEDTLLALQAINRRSQGLLNFVDNYRKLSKVSQPEPEWVKVADLINVVSHLYSNKDIKYEITDGDIEIWIDPRQIEQVMINLMKNAIEACKNRPDRVIIVSAHADFINRHFLLSVSNNGEAISHEIIDRIFVPFFTSKTNGSGIGLSISRQIVSQHGGIIKVKSDEKETTFTLQFPLIYRIVQ